MDSNTTTTHSLEIDTTNDFDSLYYELEKQILTLIADDENDECVGSMSMTAKRSTHVRINRPRHILEQQHERYFCWKHGFENNVDSLPVWLVNSWKNTSHGTGVFIPRTQHGIKPSMLLS